MTRKFIRNYTLPLPKKRLMILFSIAAKSEGELIHQTAIALELGEKITTLNYHFTKLRKGGLLDKMNRLTEKGKKLLQHLKGWDRTYEKKLRAHNIQIVFNVERLPNNFEELKTHMFTPFTNKKYSGLKTLIYGCWVMFYSKKKVVVSIPDIFGNSDEEISAAILSFVSQLKEGLELEFTGLKIDSHKPARYSTMHVAIVDAIIAEQFILEHKRNFSNGRVAVDKSHGRYELEAEDVKTALEDIEYLVKVEDLARENESLKTQIKVLESLLKNIRKDT